MNALASNMNGIRVSSLPELPCFELVCFRSPRPNDLPRGWPMSAGEVHCRTDGQADILHISPRRWLIWDPDPVLLKVCDRDSSSWAVTSVTGKWKGLELSGTNATRLLATWLNIEATLEGRDLARVALFDCPVLLHKHANGYSIRVERSYEHALGIAIDQVCKSEILGEISG